jgi:signal transduction histidine kinase
LLQVAADQADALGFHPEMRFSGVVDALPADLAEDLEAVLREALSNIARHAHARSAEVDLTTTRERITLQVSDDGIGLGPTTRRSGLANLRRRAERRGGALTLTEQPTGTRLCWSIPNS